MISNVYSVKQKDISLSTCFNMFLKFCMFLHWQDFQMISCECLLLKVPCVRDERDGRDRMIRPPVPVQSSWVVTHTGLFQFQEK